MSKSHVSPEDNRKRVLKYYYIKKEKQRMKKIKQEEEEKGAHRKCGFWETPNDPRW